MKFLFTLMILFNFTVKAADLSSYFGVKTNPSPITGGVVKCTEEYPSHHFNEHIRKFLIPTFPPNKIRLVSCTEGLYLTGTLSFKDGGKLNTHNLGANQSLQVDEKFPLKIVVPTTDERSFGFEVHFSGEVNGNRAELTFEDKEGQIFLEGEIYPNDEGTLVFSAPFRYTTFLFKNESPEGIENSLGMIDSHGHHNHQGTAASFDRGVTEAGVTVGEPEVAGTFEGVIGLFEVPVCDFFECE